MMNEEKQYLAHKKKTLIDLVNKYNSCYVDEYKFKIDEENFDIKDLCHPEYCEGCGKCCKRFPCVYSPNDFLDITDLDYMREILNTGVVTIVKYANRIFNPLIIRNRGVHDSDYIACEDVDCSNTCILHTEKGCMLPDVYRGSNGLLYVKTELGHIFGHVALYSEEYYGYLDEYANQKYQKALAQLYLEYSKVIIPKESITEEKVNQFVKKIIHKKSGISNS